MHISFVRTAGAPDRIYVRRTDGSEVGWSFPSYGDELPHDLVHVVVESEFGLRDAIWAAVDRGVDPGRVLAHANRVGGRDKFRGSGLDKPEVALSEALAAARWAEDVSDEERLAAIDRGCASYGVERPPSVTLEGIARVRTRLDDLRARWRTLLPKGAIDLTF